MTPTVRTASDGDLDFLQRHDRHPLPAALRRAVAEGRVLMLDEGEEHLGWLRWSLFWDEHPFLNMVFLLEEHRRQGKGGLLLDAWERAMEERGHRLLFTSTASDEGSQRLYRRRGYRDAGVLLVPGDVAELLMVRELDVASSPV